MSVLATLAWQSRHRGNIAEIKFEGDKLVRVFDIPEEAAEQVEMNLPLLTLCSRTQP